MNKNNNSALLSAPVRDLYIKTKELYDKCWYIRFYNDISWIYGVTDQELISYKTIYDSTFDNLYRSQLLEGQLLTTKKIKLLIDSLPEIKLELFLLKKFKHAFFRGLIAYVFFPYGLYLILMHIRKTIVFTNLLLDINMKTENIINLLETENIEDWLLMEKKE